MNIESIPVVCVSYNSVELITDLLSSFRKFYKNEIHIIDGSDDVHYKTIESVCQNFQDVSFKHFDYNIHHGPGMAWAIENLGLTGRVLFLDSDIVIVNNGFLEALNEVLTPTMFGVGMVGNVNEGGFDVAYEAGAIKYLHPACMLCNIEVMRQWPLPTKHGAPMTEAMIAIHKAADSTTLLGHVPWVANDFTVDSVKQYIRHDWRGTVSATGGYHLDEWLKGAQEDADFLRSILSLLPETSHRVVEIGCGSGAFARAFKALNPNCHYTGIEHDPVDATLAAVSCNTVLRIRPDDLTTPDFERLGGSKMWLFYKHFDTIVDPWTLLTRIRKSIATDGCVVACIPNAQHWMMQAKLGIGDFRYEDSGYLKRSQVRFFTRASIFEIFQSTGYKIEQGFPRMGAQPKNEGVLSAISAISTAVGANSELAVQDSLAIEYVVKAIPV